MSEITSLQMEFIIHSFVESLYAFCKRKNLIWYAISIK